jgi:hypothetical protein
MWCCRGMENMVWTNRVENEEVLRRVRRHTYSKRRKANWTGNILGKNCHLKYIFEKVNGKRR